MIYRLFVIFILCITTSVSYGKKRKARQSKPSPPYKWYYLVPVDATADWIYEIPECTEVSKEDYKVLAKPENCKNLPDQKAEACLSRAERELRHSKTSEKKYFALNYILFDSKKVCDENRSQIVPFAAPPVAKTTPTTTTTSTTTTLTVPNTSVPAAATPAENP